MRPSSASTPLISLTCDTTRCLLAPDQAANLLEVGVVEDDEVEYVIHAMRARPQYLDAIGKG